MFIPGSRSLALPLLIINLLCWGSWGNSAKWSRLPFPQFYFMYSGSCVVWTLGLGFLLGSDLYASDPDHKDILRDFKELHLESVAYACASGALFNIANLGLCILIRVCGLATSFPLCIGTGMVSGTLLSYWLKPGNTDFTLLCSGLGAGVLALVFMGVAYRLKLSVPDVDDDASVENPSMRRLDDPLITLVEHSPEHDMSGLRNSLCLTVGACIVTGLTMGGFPPLELLAQKTMTPYTCLIFYCGAAFVTTLPLCGVLRLACCVAALKDDEQQLQGESFFQVYSRFTLQDSVAPAIGSLVWAIGTMLNFVCGKTVNVAVAYAIGQAAPLAAVCWGLFWFREFAGSPTSAYVWLFLCVAAYSVAIALLAAASGS